MPSFQQATVVDILASRANLQKVSVQLGRGIERAYVLTELLGEVAVGDQVICNTTAVDLSLGTGGWHFVHWNLTAPAFQKRGPGHIMKLRYTSLQTDSGAAEENFPNIPNKLDGTPVVACGLHSQVGAVISSLTAATPTTRVSYVMTDGGALPLALSDLVYELQNRGALAGTITFGNAFGGDLEAVSLPSALLLARHVQKAQVIVVGMGPGITGTGTKYGHSGVEVANILNTAAALDGVGVVCARMSNADQRQRHRGISHHTQSALTLTLAPTAVPIPQGYLAMVNEPHFVVPTDIPPEYRLGEDIPKHLTTMGRSQADDPLFFESCAASAAYTISLMLDNGI